MRLLPGPGPVFYYEWLLASRRWQLYAARALFLLVLLAAVGVVWAAHADSYFYPSRQALARAGESIYYAVVGTQLALVLLAAPAATAGSVCLDKARGTLAHLLVTDLSGAEIVLGKLAARLLPILGLLLGTLPVLALTILMGGLDPVALAGAFLVTLGVAVAGCALALLLSVWGHKTHEVLLINYLLWAAFLLAYPVWEVVAQELARGTATFAPPIWLRDVNPFWLVFAPYASPGRETLSDSAIFLAGCLAVSVVLTAVAVLSLRVVAVRQAGRGARRRRPSAAEAARFRPPWARWGPSLDANPVLWREWHRRRPSRGVAVVWVIYVVAAVFLTGLALVLHLGHPQDQHDEFPALVNAAEVVIGLLLVSVTSSTSLAEERARGSLDVLLTTPLPTRAIVWGKWWGAYRTVLLLAILPGLLTAALVPAHGHPVTVVLLVGLILAYGAALTSLGLALAVWVPRLGRAVACSVTAYVLVTVAWPILVFTLAGRYGVEEGAMASPFWGVGMVSVWMQGIGGPHAEGIPWAALIWIGVYLGAAGFLYIAARESFEHCLGRAAGKRPGRSGPRPAPPAACRPESEPAV